MSPHVSERPPKLSVIINERSWDRVLARLKSHPNEASEVVSHGGYGKVLPLHEACQLQPPATVVQALVKVHGESAYTKGLWGFLPLHLAVRSNGIEAVAALLDAYPEGATAKEEKGKLPIHLACEWGTSVEIIDRLLLSNPESIYVRDNDGKLPMDHAEEMKDNISNKAHVIAVMECGPAYCAVSQTGECAEK